MTKRALSPWEGRARQLERDPKVDYYADYAAWEEWMWSRLDVPCPFGNEETGCTCDVCEAARWWENATLGLKAQFYALMSEVVERYPIEAVGWLGSNQSIDVTQEPPEKGVTHWRGARRVALLFDRSLPEEAPDA
jgi:hypothetical protein